MAPSYAMGQSWAFLGRDTALRREATGITVPPPIRQIGALIATPARSHLANRELENCGNRSEKGQSDAAQQGYQRTNVHNKFGTKCPLLSDIM